MKHIRPPYHHVATIRKVIAELAALSDRELAVLTRALRGRLASGESLDDLLPQAYAAVSEAMRRTGGRPCSDAELRAGIAMHHRAVVEVADPGAWPAALSLAVYLGALEGRGVHLMTADGAPHTTVVCRLLGLSVAHLSEHEEDERKDEAYAADVTVGSAVQFGRDHLHDNWRCGPGERMRRGAYRAVVADADHVLLDLAADHVMLKRDEDVLAVISMGAFLRLYEHLAGVSATALTDAAELAHHYGLSVEPIDVKRSSSRRDHRDLVYATTQAKLAAMADAAAEHHAAGRPVLLHTISAETGEQLAALLAERDVPVRAADPRRPLAHAGRLNIVTLLVETAAHGEVVLGGDLDRLAEESVLASGLDPLSASDEMWDEAVANARHRLERRWIINRQGAIDAGGLVVLAAERLRSRRLEARVRALAGVHGQTRFYCAVDEDWLAPHVSAISHRTFQSIEGPAEGWLIAKWINRVQLRIEERIAAHMRRWAAFDAIAVSIGERMYADRAALVSGDDPVTAASSLVAQDHEQELRTKPAEQVRAAAQEAIDSSWTGCLRGLRALLDVYEEKGFPEEELPSFRRQAETMYEDMRRDASQRLTDRLSLPSPESMPSATQWYVAPAENRPRYPWRSR
ncbi:hypothetical protein [Nonomuraea sp. NPDC050786]|uniref:preprotein translocase subunit SecA n=1 Tax=Nonomuraea sp. NPDC050786 TaxID=3154840 RepID=UPI0033E54BF5